MANEKNRMVDGLALAFNWEYICWDPSNGTYFESIAPEALDNCDFSDVVFLREHQANQLLARNTAGTLSLNVDSTGLRFQAVLPKTSLGADTGVLIQRGDLSKCSFGFYSSEKDSIWQVGSDGIPRRRIVRIQKILDVSVVCWPASNATGVFLSSVDSELGDFLPQAEPLQQIERTKSITMQPQLRSTSNEVTPEKPTGEKIWYECASPTVVNSARSAQFARARAVAKSKEVEQPDKEVDWRAELAARLAKSNELKKRHEEDYLSWQQNEAAKKQPVSDQRMAEINAKMRQLAELEKPKLITSW